MLNRIKIRRYALLLLFLCIMGISLLCRATTADVVERWFSSPEISLVIGETKSLAVNSPTQVKIGNPKLMDVVGAGQKELLLSGLSEGETTLSVVDAYGERKYTVRIFAEDLEKIKERVEILLEAAGYKQIIDASIGYKERKIFLTGSVPDTQKEDFQAKIAPVSDKIIDLITYESALSVEIDVEVLEIGKTDIDKLGIDWTKEITFTEGGTASETVRSKAIEDFPKEVLKVITDGRYTALTAELDFLKQNNKARTLSRPKLVCLSGKEATLHVGGERPIITGMTTSSGLGMTTTTYEIELKEYGIKLLIKPTVKDKGQIKVQLKSEIIEIDQTNRLDLTNTISTPGFTDRTAETELTILDGQTIFLAGLISSKRDDDRDSVQGLGSIPFLGALFRHREVEQRDTEVVITLTPTVKSTQPPAYASSSATTTIIPSLRSASLGDTSTTIAEPISKDDNLIRGYTQLIQNIIYSNVAYPSELRGKNIAGTVKLSLHVQSSGELLGVVVMRSSGNAVLDELAELTVKKLSPFPPFPEGLKLNELWIDMPIVYKLGNST